MISRLRGQVLEVALDHGVLDVGGVGLTVHTTPAVLAELSVGQQADLATVLLVREDSLTLYGFTDPASRELFVLLQTVAGIGPRVALATLAVLSPTELQAVPRSASRTRAATAARCGVSGTAVAVTSMSTPVGATVTASASQYRWPEVDIGGAWDSRMARWVDRVPSVTTSTWGREVRSWGGV